MLLFPRIAECSLLCTFRLRKAQRRVPCAATASHTDLCWRPQRWLRRLAPQWPRSCLGLTLSGEPMDSQQMPWASQTVRQRDSLPSLSIQHTVIHGCMAIL